MTSDLHEEEPKKDFTKNELKTKKKLKVFLVWLARKCPKVDFKIYKLLLLCLVSAELCEKVQNYFV